MKLFVSSIILCLGAAITSASPTPQQPTFDPSKVYIESITYSGSGCPADSVEVIQSADGTELALELGAYFAYIGGGHPITDNRKNCNFNINLHYPNGFQITVYETTYSGFASLQDGVQATQQSDYWFAGFPLLKATFRTTIVGPFDDYYMRTDSLGDKKLVLSPCGASTTLNINTQVVLSRANPASTAEGDITVDDIDHKAATKFRLGWFQC